jgi:hypothetical protein
MEKLSLMLYFIEKLVNIKIDKDKLKLGDFTANKSQLYQLYFVLNRLDIPKFLAMDFITNFGVSFGTKKILSDLFETGGGFHSFETAMKGVEMREMLFVFKYFFWADKKIRHVSYTENKEDISEDLLHDILNEKKKGDLNKMKN